MRSTARLGSSMRRELVEAPEPVLAPARSAGLLIPSLMGAEVFRPQHSHMQVYVFTSPAIRVGTPVVLVALANASIERRREFLELLDRLVAVTDLRLPRARCSTTDDVTIFSADWAFRGEIRALIDSACTSEQAPDHLSEPVSLFAPSGPEAIESATWRSVSNEISQEAFRRSLYEFVLASDPLWRGFIRKISGASESRVWKMPLGCSVEEVVNREGAYWQLQFEDLDLLERSIALVDRRLASGKAALLELAHSAVYAEGETEIPVVRLVCRGNTREGRVQMARMIQYVLNSLDRMSFASRPGQRALAAVMDC